MKVASRLIDLSRRAFDLVLEKKWQLESRGSSVFEEPPPPLAATARIFWPRSYDWHSTGKWVDGIRDALGRRVPVLSAEIAQPFERVVCFEVERAGQRFKLAIDYADKSEIHPRCAGESLLYFKMQFRRGGYAPHLNVVPGGYITGNHEVYRYLRPVRALRDRRDFEWDVNARFGLRFAADVRTRAVTMLNAQTSLRFNGGTSLVRYSRHLREIARSKVCVDLPGNGDFCFRLVDYFAVGACVVALRHGNRLPVELVDGEQIVWIRDDLSDLVEKCTELARDDERRERIARNARRYFDVHLQEQVLADYYLDRIFAAQGAAVTPALIAPAVAIG